MTGGAAHLQQYLVQTAYRCRGQTKLRRMRAEQRQPRELHQLLRHFINRQNIRSAAGGDGAFRHAVIFGGGRFLRHTDAAGAENGAQALRAVRRGTREDDADGVFRLILGQRGEEGVDRPAHATRQLRQRQL